MAQSLLTPSIFYNDQHNFTQTNTFVSFAFQNEDLSEGDERCNWNCCNCSKNGKFCVFIKTYYCIIITFIIVGTIGILFFTPLRKTLLEFIGDNVYFIRNWGNNYYWSFNSIMTSIGFVWVLTPIPGRSLFNIAMAFITQSIIRSFLVNFISGIVGIVVIWVITKFC